MKANKVLTVIWDYFLLSLGTALYCMGWTSFLIPNGIASGGLTGLCTIMQFGTGIPIGWSFPVLNALLLILGVIFLGKAFGFKTIYVIALSSLLFEVLPHFPQLEVTTIPDKVMVALVGGTMESIGIGLTILRGGSTGGTDIVAIR